MKEILIRTLILWWWFLLAVLLWDVFSHCHC